MSRSHKKHHYCVDPKDKDMKRLASRIVRRVPIELTDTLQGGGYLRYFESWDISDYAWNGDKFPLDEIYGEDGKYLRDWRIYHYNK